MTDWNLPNGFLVLALGFGVCAFLSLAWYSTFAGVDHDESATKCLPVFVACFVLCMTCGFLWAAMPSKATAPQPEETRGNE